MYMVGGVLCAPDGLFKVNKIDSINSSGTYFHLRFCFSNCFLSLLISNSDDSSNNLSKKNTKTFVYLARNILLNKALAANFLGSSYADLV